MIVRFNAPALWVQVQWFGFDSLLGCIASEGLGV